jgi:MFS family permease
MKKIMKTGINFMVGYNLIYLGNLSAGYGGDKLIKNYGRRYLLIGTGIVGIFFSLLFESLTLSSLFQVIAGYVAIQGFSNLAIGAVQPVIAEISNESDRGTSAGINGFFSLMGSAMGFGITSIFLSSGYYNSAIYSLMIGISITGLGSAIVIDRYDRRNRSAGESTVTCDILPRLKS